MEPSDARVTPWVRNLVLLVGFLALVVVGIWTVLVPELREDPPEEQTQPTEAPSPDPPP